MSATDAINSVIEVTDQDFAAHGHRPVVARAGGGRFLGAVVRAVPYDRAGAGTAGDRSQRRVGSG